MDEDGINAYVSAWRYGSEQLKNSERPYPFNSDDLTRVCLDPSDPTTCGGTGVVNGIDSNTGAFFLSTAANFLLRPSTLNPNNSITPVPGSRFQNAGPCTGNGTLTSLTVAQQGATAPAQVCQYDYSNLYGVIQPEIERWGVSGRATAKVGDSAEAYGEANFMEAVVSYDGFPGSVIANANTGVFYPRFSTSTHFPTNPTLAPGSIQMFLPVFVCPERVNCATSPNGVLNPNNPFAAAGQVARVIGRDHGSVTHDETLNRSYRFAAGLNGTFSNGWDYDLNGTVMHTDLLRSWTGYRWIQHFLDVVADGTYNFANPSATPQSVLDYLSPPGRAHATSDQAQLEGSVTIPVFELPGGTTQLVLGGSTRYEAVDAPSGNTDLFGPTQRYFTLNAFGTAGSRTVNCAFFEVAAPVLDNLDVNVSGRLDDYSSGQSAFSPRIGARFRPIDMLTLRASYSEGFRIPSFAEANGLPTTGFVTN
ncbi:MAG: TonB-dependent receptor, partial [Fimbriimonadaceae bacterium]